MVCFKRYSIVVDDIVGVSSEILTKLKNAEIDLKLVEIKSGEIQIKLYEELEKNLMDSLIYMDYVKSVDEIKYTDSEKNEKNLLMLLDSVDDGIISIDNSYKILSLNDTCEKMFSIKRGDFINCDLSTRSSLCDLADEILSGISRIDYREFEFDIDGNKYKKIVSCRSILDNNENTVGVIFLIKNIEQTISISMVSNLENYFIGNNDVINRIKKYIELSATSTSSVMILGESGTGKEVVAKEIVSKSDRKDKPFVSINCAALPDNLIESELFGYKKGAFTGANTDKKGLFLEANGGTLFLDEIGEMGIFTQAKLLRVLQENKIRRVGSHEEEEIDVRIISATNRNLEEMVRNEKFREDLYYRLNVLPIKLPPLRERKDDIPLLVDHFIDNLNIKLSKNIIGYSEDFIEKIKEMHLNGNVRELKNIVERSMNICENNILTEDCIYTTESFISKYYTGKNKNESDDIINRFDKLEEKYYLGQSNKIGRMIDEKISKIKSDVKTDEKICLKKLMEDIEADILTEIIKDNKNSIRNIAKELDLSHTTLINKCKRYNIKYI